MLALHVLASGSKGNAAVVEDHATGDALLIDCGLTAKAFLSRCEEVGFEPSRLQAVVVTHDHGDHTSGLGVVLRALGRQMRRAGGEPTPLPVYGLPAVCANSRALVELAEKGEGDLRCMACGERLEVGSLGLQAFVTSHDASASCGFRIESADGDALGYLTDSGTVTREAASALRGVRLLALESNHDAAMLRDGSYPYQLKQRVASDCGHLSNEQAAEALVELAGPRLQAVCAMHLSQENNRPSLAEQAFVEALERAGCGARVLVAGQRCAVTLG